MPDMPADPQATSCRHAPGQFVPVIDRNRCEGKGPCVNACRYDVLSMGVLDKALRAQLSIVGRFKALAHGHRQALVALPEACSACGDCVKVCPEHAITLEINPYRTEQRRES